MTNNVPIVFKTPEPEKYKDDCLHPCVRYIEEGFAGHQWWMVMTPYPDRNSKYENPMLYYSDDRDIPVNWKFAAIVQDSHEEGYNSDPNLFYEEGKLWIYWRECNTPACKKEGATKITLGVFTVDGVTFSNPSIYLKQFGMHEDTEMCPTLAKIHDVYYFYATHTLLQPVRQSKGLCIWKGSSLLSPDFQMIETIKLSTPYTCDKYKQKKIFGKLVFIPRPLKHNTWHFDLILYKNVLYMVSVDEWGDNIMIAASADYRNFRFRSTPLINNHYNESKGFARTYYYKPSIQVINDRIFLFYTEIADNQNILKLSLESVKKIFS